MSVMEFASRPAKKGAFVTYGFIHLTPAHACTLYLKKLDYHAALLHESVAETIWHIIVTVVSLVSYTNEQQQVNISDSCISCQVASERTDATQTE